MFTLVPMSNLAQRFLTGIAGAALITFLLWWQPLSLAMLFFLLAMFTLLEFTHIVRGLREEEGKKTAVSGNLLAGACMYWLIVAVGAGWLEQAWLTLILPLMALFFIAELYLKRNNPFQHIGLQLIGLLYVVLPFALLTNMALKDSVFQPILAMGILYTVWSDNIFAYFAGRFLGKHKLFERISPKKTWEGFAGGFIMALVCTYIFSLYYTDLTTAEWMFMGALISITGTFGDLVESLFKRNLHLKDSSQVLPGHGGFLDRFDALLLAIPFVYAYLALLRL
jgi:phosphatidate cytidylyltransferase